MPPPRPTRAIILFLDWDSTLTTASTLSRLASVSTYPNPHPAFAGLSAQYADDLAAHARSYAPRVRERRGMVAERRYLNSLRRVEETSLSRVASSGIFAGVSTADLRRLAQRCIKDNNVSLRPRWKNLIEHTQASWSAHRSGEVHIVSVNWSKTFIQACLEAEAGRAMGDDSGDGRGEGYVGVFANEIDGSGNGKVVAAGEGEGLILTSGDKERVVKGLEKGYREQWKGSSVAVVSVYVGDSVTDLGGLMACDVGICVRNMGGKESAEQRELRETLERVGVEVRWIGKMKESDLEGLEKWRVEDEEKKVVWWAKGLEEVVESVLYKV